jgi:hypothetical protein
MTNRKPTTVPRRKKAVSKPEILKGSVSDLFDLQPLEERLLFSANTGSPDDATALLPDAIKSLHSDISTVVDFGAEVAKYADLAKSIPGIADSIGGLLDFVGSKGDAGILFDQVQTPLVDYFNGFLKSGTITAGDVNTKLSALGFTNVSGGFYAATSEFEWQFTIDKTVNKQFDLATSFAAAGFAIDPLNIDVTGDFSLTLSFGVKSDGSGFFITVPDLDLSLSVAATSLNFGVEFGDGAKIGVKDGEITATISAENISAAGGAKLTAATIADGLAAEIPSITPVGSIEGSLPLEVVSFITPVLEFSISDVFAPGASIEPSVSFPLTNSALQTKILDILGNVESYAGSILAHPALTTDLPILNQSVADTGIVADLEGMLKLRTLADDYFKSTATPDISGLKDALSTGLGALGTLLGNFNSLAKTYEIDFDLSKTVTLVDQELKGITDGAAAYGLEFPDAIKVGIDATATAKFSLGIDLSDKTITASDFYVRIDELSAGAEIDASGINLGLKLDNVNVGIKDGSIKLDALAEFTLSDPNDDGKITAAEMKSSTLEIEPSGVLTAKLPFNIASTSFGALLVTVPDVFASGAKPQFGFSFDIDSNLQNLILNTLSTTDGYASSVLNSAAFTTTIPLIEKTVGDIVQSKSIETALTLHDVAEDYFKSVKGGDLPTFIGLLGALEDHAKTITGGFTTFYNQVTKTHELTLDLAASAGIKDLELQFGAQATSLGLDFNSGLKVDVDGRFNANLTLGIDLTDTNFTSTDFYVKFNEVKASVDVHASDINIGIELDGKSLGIVGGSVNLDVDATIEFTDPNKDGKIDASEVGSVSVSVDPVGEVYAELPLNVIAAGFPTVIVEIPDVFAAAAEPEISFNFYLTDENLQTYILDTLDTFSGYAKDVAGSAFLNTSLPLIDKTILELVNAQDIEESLDFKTTASKYFADSLANDVKPDIVGLLDALKQENFGGFLTGNYDAKTEQFTIDFDINLGLYDDTLKLNLLDDLATEMGISSIVNISAIEIDVTASAFAKFTLGVDLSDTKIESKDFYAKFDEVGLELDAEAKDLALTLNIGPASAGIKDGTAEFTARAELKFEDPNNDGKITLAELSGLKTSIDVSGAADVDLPLTIKVGSYEFKPGGIQPKIRATSSNVFEERLKIDVSTADFDRIFNIGRMGPKELLDLVIAAGDWANQFRNSDLFNIEIPFLNGVDLGDAFDFGLAFSKTLRANMESTFVQVDSDAKTLNLTNNVMFGVAIGADLKSVTLPSGNYDTLQKQIDAFNTAFGTTWATSAPLKAILDAGADTDPLKTDDDFMRIVATDPAKTPNFSLVASQRDLKALGLYDGDTVASLTTENDIKSDFKLSGDAKFEISIDGSAEVTVEVKSTSTSTNASLKDLVADINTALAAAKVTGVSASESSGKIAFTGGATVGSFAIVGTPNTAFAELGLANEQAAGISELGSITETVPKFSTFESFVTTLTEAIGLAPGTIVPNYDPVTETFSVKANFGYNPTPFSVPVGFNIGVDGLASLSVESNKGLEALVTITPKLNASLEFGYTFKPGGDGQTISIAPEEGYISPAGYKDAEEGDLTPLAWDGKLSADAKITFVFDDGIARDLTISQSSTTDNKSVDDLIKDIEAAISATAGLKGILSVGSISGDDQNAERLMFSVDSTKSQTLQIKTADGNTSRTELGFRSEMYTQADSGVMGVRNAEKITLAPSDDARWDITIDNDATRTVTVSKTNFADNKSLSDLLSDLNLALKTAKDSGGNVADLSGKLSAIRVGTGNNFQFVVTDSKVRTLRIDADETSKAVSSEDSLTKGTPDGLGFDTDETFARARGGGFFIKDAKLTGEAIVSMEDISLKAQLGFIEITAADSAGSLSFKVEAELKDIANKGNTNFAIGDLLDIVSSGEILDIVQISASSLGNLSFSGIGVAGGGFSLPIPSNAGIAFKDVELFSYDSKTGFTSSPTFTPIFTGIDAFTNFRSLDFGKVLDIVIEGVNYLSNTDAFSFLNYEIPVINISPVEFLNYAKELKDGIAAAKEGDSSSLQNLERSIEDILNLPANALTISIDPATFSHPDNATIINFSLTYEKSHSDTFGMNLDLESLGSLAGVDLSGTFGTLTDLVDLGATGNIEFSAYAKAQLDLGIQITPNAAQPLLPPAVEGFLYDSSGIELGLRVFGQNLNFTASAGGFGLAVTDGTVVLDSDGKIDVTGKNGVPDGVVDNDYATVNFGLKGNTGSRYTFTDFSTAIKDSKFTSLFEITGNGKLEAILPVEAITPFGNISLDAPIEIKADSIYNLIVRPPSIKPITITAPDIRDFIPETPGIIQLLRDPSILLDGVDNALFRIQQGLDSQTAQNLPLIGNRLGEGAQMIEEFRSGLLARLTEQLRGAGDKLLDNIQDSMFKLFHTDLKLLQDLNNDGKVTKADIAYTFLKEDGKLWVDGTDAPKLQDAVQFDFHLGQKYTAPIPDLKVDFAVPGLGLKVDATPEVSISWDLHFGFGVSVTDFFYLATEHKDAKGNTVTSELEVNFDVALTKAGASAAKATGTLFFLELEAVDAKFNDGKTTDSTYSGFNGKFAVDLQEPDPSKSDKRLTMPELFKRGGTQKPLTATLSASADVDLALTLRFADIAATTSINESKVFPKLYADFQLDWEWKLGDKTVAKPSVGLYNINLDLGSFISDFLGPIAEKINDIIKPFDPILDALATRIPVLSDFMGRTYTVLDLAADFGKVDRRFIDAVYDVRALVKLVAEASIEAKSLGTPIKLLIGHLPDVSDLKSANGGLLGLVNSGTTTATKAAASGLAGGSSPKTEAAFKKSTSATGGGFQFPILKPENILKLLTGKGDVTLVAYDIPKLEVKMEMSKSFRIYGPLVGTFRGEIGAWMDLAVGFDTKGLNQYKISGDPIDVLDGFYISDRANADGTGADVPEAGLFGEIAIGGGLDIGIARAGIEGIFRATADLDLNDPNDDGKIRASEIYSLLTYKTPDGKSYGPLNLGSIKLKGTVGARAYVDVNLLFGWKNVWSYRTPTVTIFEKTFAAPRPQPTLATASGGNLTLNGGPSAADRSFGSTTDVGESYTITGTGSNVTVLFNNTGISQTYTGVTALSFNGGKGDDVLDVRNFAGTVNFIGGEGNDTVYTAKGGGTYDMGSGNDIIYGNIGVDKISGGVGADTIYGGDGNDILDGGDGNDLLIGGAGDDTYVFGDGWGTDSLDVDDITSDTSTLGKAGAAGNDTLDFSKATSALTIAVGSTTSRITQGKNTLTLSDENGTVGKIIAGAAEDQITINSSKNALTLDGGESADTYSFGFGRIEGEITISDSGGGASGYDDDVRDTIVVTPLISAPITLFDAKVESLVTVSGGPSRTERVNFGNTIENMVIDAPKSDITVGNALDFIGEVRLKALSATIGNSITANHVRVESKATVDIAAYINGRFDGNVEVIVSGGDILLSKQVMSSAGLSSTTGDGGGVIQLMSMGGEIKATGGDVKASYGSLLLLGTKGSIGTAVAPIKTEVENIAARTTGDGTVYIIEEDGVFVTEVAGIKGVNVKSGDITLLNKDNVLHFLEGAKSGGGDLTFTSDKIQIDADLESKGSLRGGDLTIQPMNTNIEIGIGDGRAGEFSIGTSEIAHFLDGFGSITIGRADGTHDINIGDVEFVDPIVIRNPILGGHITQDGEIVASDDASITVLGSGHTITLANQTSVGTINIIDSAIIPEAGSVALTSTGGGININFDIDGTAGGAAETLTLDAQGGAVFIQGNVGSSAKLGRLVIKNASAVQFEGTVNVGELVIEDVSTNQTRAVTIKGAVTADSIDLQTAGTVDFRSAVNVTGDIKHTAGTLNTVLFQGAVSAANINLSAQTLVDFFQSVTAPVIDVTTTGLAGDIQFRQSVTATTSITVNTQDDVTFSGAISATALTIENAADVSFQAFLDVANILDIQSVSGIASFASVEAASVSINAASIGFTGTLTTTDVNGTNSVTSTAGTLTIGGALNSAGTVEASATGLISIVGAANAKSAEIDGSSISYLSFNTAQSLKLTAALAGSITGISTTTVGTDFTIERANTVSLNGSINVTGAFVQSEASGLAGGTTTLSTTNAASVNIAATNISLGGAMTTTAAGGTTLKAAGNGNITANAGITTTNGPLVVPQAGTVTLNAAVDVASANITATNSIIVANGATFATNANGQFTTTSTTLGEIKFTGQFNIGGNATVTAARGLTFQDAVNVNGTLSVPTSSSITLSGVSSAGTANLNATNTITVGIGGISTTAGNLTLVTTAAGAGNGVTASGPVAANALLDITTPRGLALNETVSAGAIDIDAASISLPSTVSATNDIILLAASTGNITLGATATSTGGNLVIDRAKDISFSGLVSAVNIRIGTAVGSAIASIAIGAGGMTSTAATTLITTASGPGNGITDIGPISTGLASSLVIESPRGVDLDGVISTGNFDVTGASISTSGTVNSTNSDFDSTGTLTVGAAITATNTLTITRSTEASFLGKVTAATVNIGGTENLTFNTEIAVSGDATISTTGNVNLLGKTSVNGTLSIPTTRDVAFAGLTSVGTVSIGTTTARNISTALAGFTATSGATFTARAVGGSISAAGPLTVDSGALAFDTVGSFSAAATVSADSISGNAATSAFTGAVTSDVGSITLNVETAGVGQITFGNTISSALDASVGRTRAPLSIAIQGAASAGRDLLFSAAQTVNASSSLTAVRDVAIATNSATAGEARILGAVNTGRDLLVDVPRDVFFQSVTAVGRDTRIGTARNIQFQAPLNVTGSLVQTAGTGTASYVSITAANIDVNSASISVNGTLETTSGDASFTAASNGDLNVTGLVSVAGVLFVDGADDVVFGSAVTAASVDIGDVAVRTATFNNTLNTTIGAIELRTNGAIAISGSVSTPTTFSVLNGTVVTLGGAVTANLANFTATSLAATGTITGTTGVNMAFTSSANVTGDILAPNGSWNVTQAAAISVTGLVTTRSTDLNGASLTIGGTFTTTTGDAILTMTGNIALNNDSSFEGALVIDQALGITFAQDVDAASLSVSNATSLTAKGVTTLDNSATIALSGDLSFEKDVTAGTSFSVPAVRDASFAGKLTAATVNIGATQARTITFSGNGLAATGDVTLNSNVAGGGVNLNAAIDSTNGTLSVTSLTPLNTTSSLNANRIVAVASGISLGGLLNADGVGVTSGIQLDVLTAGSGTIVLTGMVVSSADILIGQTTRPASVNLGGVTQATENLTIRAAETITLGANVTTVNGDISLTTTSTSLGEIRALAGVTSGRDITISAARDAVFLGAVSAADDATITTAANTSFQSTLTVADVLTQIAGTGTTSFASVSAASADLNAATIIATGTFTATSGSATFTANANGRVEITSALNVATSLIVDRAALVSFGASVTTADVNITAGQLSIIGDLRAQTGDILIATTSDVTIGGLTSAAQSLSITGSEDVTLTGTVTATDITVNAVSFLAGNTVTTTIGDLDFTASGNIRIVGVASVADDLIIRAAANVTFQGQATVANLLRQIDGTGVTRFEGVTTAATIEVKAANQFVAGSTLRALTGNIRIESEEIDFLGGTNTVQGNAELILRSYLAGTSIDVGSPTPSAILDLSDADLNALRDGFTQITIGRAEDASGAMVIGSSIFKDNTAFHAGSITVERNTLTGQQLTVLESLEMTARTGSIITNDDIDATDATFTARDNVTVNYTVQAPDFITVTAGTDGSGNISVTTEGTLEAITPGADITLTAGANDGSIFITGLVNGDDNLTFTAASGAIQQTAGLTTGTDLILLAEDGIKLITQVDHITGRVTGTGDFIIDDTNTDPAHFLNLGSPTDVNDGLFTADGDIRINVAANANAFRVEANGGLFIDVEGDVFVGTVNGSPTVITGTILLDEDRTTFGQNIEFAGNIKLLRDITLTSNGGDILISGRVNSTVGSNFKLTLDAGTGDIFIGGPIGSGGLQPSPIGDLTVVEADSVVFGDEALDQASIRVMGNIEINANAIEFNSPNNSVRTLNGGLLTLLPLRTSVAIDIGAPTGGTAVFALGDDDLSALGDSFSLITIGHTGGTHPITIESAQFRDDLVLNAESVAVLASRSAQSVNGLSVVNGSDDNSITINARTSFIQERRATISAGRFGDIEITADTIVLDDRNRSMVRGFGNLTLQPFSAAQAITLGSNGTANDFDLSVGEIASIGNGFRHIIIGRADGTHEIVIDNSVNFSDRVTIQAPEGGNITIGNANVTMLVQAVSAGDHLSLVSGGDITINATLGSAGFGNINITADANSDGFGNITIGNSLTAKSNKAGFVTNGGNVNLSAENVTVGALVTDKKVLGTTILTKTGGLNVTTADAGALTITGPKTLFTLGGGISAAVGSLNIDNAKITAKSLAANAKLDITVGLKVAVKTTADIRLETARNISVAAKSSIASTKGKIQLLADLSDASLDGNNGLISLGVGSSVKAFAKAELAALSVTRIGAIVSGKPVEVRNV